MRAKRIEEVQEYIMKHKTVPIDTLCEVFGVSRNTIRRDLDHLMQRGTISKTYGGVTANSTLETVPFEERSIKNMAAKMGIAKKATELLARGDTIFIDSGSTAGCFYQAIPKDLELTMFTNNLEVLLKSVHGNDYHVTATGGTLARKTNSLVGRDAVRTLESYNIGKAFLSATGLSVAQGATNSSQGEYEVKRAAMKVSGQVYLMVDSSKFDVVSLLTFCKLEDVDVVITDRQPPEAYAQYFQQHGVRIMIAE